MPSLGLGLTLGSSNPLKGYDADVSAFIQQTGVSSTATIKDFTGVTAPSMANVRLQGTATGLTLSATEDWTLAGWFNASAPTIVGTPNFWVGFGNGFKLYSINNGSSVFLTFEYGSNNVQYTHAIPPGTWFHMVLTSFRSGGGSQSHKLYINGTLVSTLTSSVAQTLSSPTFYIGGGGPSEYAVGVIADEVSFFKRELSSLEISFLYASGDGLSYSEASSAISMNNIYSWYSLSETTGNRLNSVNSSVCPLSSNGSGTILNARGWVAPKITINPRKQLNDFVLGIKGLGLWGNTICWPLRSSQNAGTGTTAYSLGGLGTFNGTFGGSTLPTWNADGVNFTNDSSAKITTSLAQGSSDDINIFAVVECNAFGSDANVFAGTRGGSGGSNAGFTCAQDWYGQGAGPLLWDTSGTGTINAFVTRTINGSFNAYTHRVSVSGATKTIGVKLNTGTETAVSAIRTYVAGNNLTIGSETPNATSTALGGKIPFIAYFKSASLASGFYNLYKTTLGTGLGLP